MQTYSVNLQLASNFKISFVWKFSNTRKPIEKSNSNAKFDCNFYCMGLFAQNFA